MGIWEKVECLCLWSLEMRRTIEKWGSKNMGLYDGLNFSK